MNDRNEKRNALQRNIVQGVRAVLQDAPEGALELPLEPGLPRDGISVRPHPVDRTAWIVSVVIYRHDLTDDEAETLAQIANL